MVSSLIMVVAMAVFLKLCNVQLDLSDKVAINDPMIEMREIPSPRGNIYDANGKLLAISMPVYTIAIDATQPKDSLFDNNYRDLSVGLSEIFKDRTPEEYASKLHNSRLAQKKYFRLQSEVRYSELQKVKRLPILKEGRYKGGFVYTQQTNRTNPFDPLCNRTIGYNRERNDVGIERAYDLFLKGKNGKQLMQKINGGIWKPLSNNQDLEPVPGCDVYSTIDIRIQDIAQTALLKSLERFEAENGSVILMDVQTGSIRAMSSLQRTEEGKYAENYNHAIGSAYEPGSTFKLASLLVAIEENKIDTSTIVDTKNGVFNFYDRTMKDSNNKKGGHGRISVGKAFELSSNIGIARIIVDHYKENPQKFIDRLSKLGINKRLDFELIGEAHPLIKNTTDSSWSGVSLPWMAYGYELEMTALQILALYNAVANNGILVKPKLVDQVRSGQRIIKSTDIEVLKPSICSEKTIDILKDLLERVVISGTANNIYSDKYSCAGKTGTAKIAEDGAYGAEYRASFVGYFPSQNPRYSCIVVVTKPKKEIGFYGNIVAAPVFSELRDALFAQVAKEIPRFKGDIIHEYIGKSEEINALNLVLDKPSNPLKSKSLIHCRNNEYKTLELKNKSMPNVKGMVAMDAIYILENLGLKVQMQGRGLVKSQSIEQGIQIIENQKVILRLAS